MFERIELLVVEKFFGVLGYVSGLFSFSESSLLFLLRVSLGGSICYLFWWEKKIVVFP